MVDQDNIAAAVLAWYETQWNKPTLTGKKQQVNADLSLNMGDYPWARESGDDIMQSYFRQFNVKQDAFDLFNYWPPEQGFLPNFLLPKSKRIFSAQTGAVNTRDAHCVSTGWEMAVSLVV